MKKLAIIFFIAMLCIPFANLTAQQANTSFLSFDLGYAPSYNFQTNAIGTVQMFGVNVRVANPMTVGFYTNSGDLSGGMLKIKYDVRPQLRAVFGYGTSQRVGLGFEFIPYTRTVSGISTEFKLATEYTFTSNQFQNGTIIFPLLIGIGF